MVNSLLCGLHCLILHWYPQFRLSFGQDSIDDGDQHPNTSESYEEDVHDSVVDGLDSGSGCTDVSETGPEADADTAGPQHTNSEELKSCNDIVADDVNEEDQGTAESKGTGDNEASDTELSGVGEGSSDAGVGSSPCCSY